MAILKAWANNRKQYNGPPRSIRGGPINSPASLLLLRSYRRSCWRPREMDQVHENLLRLTQRNIVQNFWRFLGCIGIRSGADGGFRLGRFLHGERRQTGLIDIAQLQKRDLLRMRG